MIGAVREQPARDLASEPSGRVSIALCTYNGERFLREQLDSFLTQTRLPDELVICDDRSSDSTVSIIESFSDAAPFPVHLYINETNLGSTGNFQRAISLCGGDLIFLSDQDDVWRHDKVDALCQIFRANPNVGLVFSDAEVVGADLRPLGYRLWQSMEFGARSQARLEAGGAFEVLLKHNVVTGAAMAFRRSLRDVAMPIPSEWIHDGWIAMILSLCSELRSYREPLIRYRQHGQNQVGGLRKNLQGELAYMQHVGPQQYLHVAQQYRAVLDWVKGRPDLPSWAAAKQQLEAKIAHFIHRAELSSSWADRMACVSKAWVAGDYRRFSRGWKSALKDAFMPTRQAS